MGLFQIGHIPWNSRKLKICINCGELFWNRRNKKFCSANCCYEYKKGFVPYWAIKKGEKNYKWKGNEVGYSALHHWIRRLLGKPNYCEWCGNYFTGKKIHWANKSGKYKRDLSDWIRLCAKCHKKYDGGLKYGN